MVEKILNNTTPYGKIWASHEGPLHSSTLNDLRGRRVVKNMRFVAMRAGVKKFHLSPGQVKLNLYLSCCQITCPKYNFK